MSLTSEIYVYRESGLPSVTLWGGFAPADEGRVKIEAVKDLHRCIGRALTRRAGPLLPMEIDYLRAELGLTAVGLAQLLGVEPEAYRSWECGAAVIDRPADRLLRLIYLDLIGDAINVRAFLEAFQDTEQPGQYLNLNLGFDPDNKRWAARAE